MKRLFCGAVVAIFVATTPAHAAKIKLSGPPNNLTDTQKAEWSIGKIVGAADLCGYSGKTSEIRSFMNKSPHFKGGVKESKKADVFSRCPKLIEPLDSILGNKDMWETIINSSYPE